MGYFKFIVGSLFLLSLFFNDIAYADQTGKGKKSSGPTQRKKLSKVLYDYGMKVAAVSILCQDERVFEAMQMAGTPCPFEGKIGSEAMAQWNKYEVERPDYKTYVKILDTRSRIDDELKAIQLQKEQEELAKKIKEEKLKLDTLKQEENLDNIIIETDIETEEKVIINIHG